MGICRTYRKNRRRLFQALYRFAYSLTKSQHEAADLTQQTFLIYSTKGHTIKDNTKIKYREIIHNDKVAKISIVGAGMVSTPGVTYRMFRALSDESINILAISTSEIKLSVIIDEDNTLKAIKKLHTIFDLD